MCYRTFSVCHSPSLEILWAQLLLQCIICSVPSFSPESDSPFFRVEFWLTKRKPIIVLTKQYYGTFVSKSFFCHVLICFRVAVREKRAWNTIQESMQENFVLMRTSLTCISNNADFVFPHLCTDPATPRPPRSSSGPSWTLPEEQRK